MMFKELTNYFNSNIRIINNCKHIKYECLEKIFTSIRDKENSISQESFDDYLELSNCIRDFYKEIIFNGKPASLSKFQTLYNGTAVIEEAIRESYPEFFEYGNGGTDNHKDAHTDVGDPGVDFVIKNPITISYFNRHILNEDFITLNTGIKIDAKSFLDRTTFDDSLKTNEGRYGHYGDYMIVYLLVEKCWYLVENKSNPAIYPLIKFNPEFKHDLLKFTEDSKGLIHITNFMH